MRSRGEFVFGFGLNWSVWDGVGAQALPGLPDVVKGPFEGEPQAYVVRAHAEPFGGLPFVLHPSPLS